MCIILLVSYFQIDIVEDGFPSFYYFFFKWKFKII